MLSKVKRFYTSNENFIMCMVTMFLGYFFGYCFVAAILDRSWWRVFLYLYLSPYWLYRSFTFWKKASFHL